MVDKNQNNDEYQFDDLDVSSDMMDDDLPSMKSNTGDGSPPKRDIRRNALIVVVLVILAMIVYKFMGSIFTSKTDTVPATTQTTTTPPITPVATTTPVVTPPVQSTVVSVPPVNNQPSSEVNQKLSALEIGQQNMRTEVTSLSNQLTSLSSNVNDLSNKIATLSQTVSTLAARVEQQSQQIAVLTVRARPKQTVHVVRKVTPRPVYYIQAVIPGRAWLIATNGSTLTVREGTKIAGYGIVKLIDPSQGRVLMSTGQIIRFSQQDS